MMAIPRAPHISLILKTFWKYTPEMILTAGGIWVLHKVGSEVSTYLYQKRMLISCKESPKDIVIVRTIGRGKTVPNCSPFVIKLETYLRMFNIPYQIDNTYPFSPTGKTPWITLNGEHYMDSQIIIEFLEKKFEKTNAPNYSAEQKAYGRAIRIMMDEYFYWGMCLWRYVYDEGDNLKNIFDMPGSVLRSFGKNAEKRVGTNAWAQGIGRLSKQEVLQTMTDNLRALSTILGKKKFILGDEPCDIDCTVFGMLAQALWSAPQSPYETVINHELINLKEYCIRMKETFWPDWDKCLAGSSQR